jgi:transposase
MLSRQEKERLVVDLYNQGKTIRDIAKDLRISFRDIGSILKKASGEKEEKRDIKESLSPSVQAYRLFSKGKTPIDVAITLNLSEAETTKYYEEYWDLNQMHELRMVYDEIGGDILHFLKLYRLSKVVHMNPEHVVKLL